jgi:tetratricopeptide (TPR) repeat protein
MKIKKISVANQERSDDLLFEAYAEKSNKKRIKLLNDSLIYNPYNTDSLIALSKFTKNLYTRLEELQLAIEIATLVLENSDEDYFSVENIGIFWGLVETRPFMRAQQYHILTLMEVEYYYEAIHRCKQLLVLCENDNMGIRYILMKLFALTKNLPEALQLIEQFDEDLFTFKFPFALLLFHTQRYEEAENELSFLLESYPFAKSIIIYNKKPNEKEIESLSYGVRMGQPEEVYSVIGFHQELMSNEFKTWFRDTFKTKGQTTTRN